MYWDPKSSKELLEMNLPLVCIPLDVTNKVPITKSFLSSLAYQASKNISSLAGQLWALTMDTIPNYYHSYFMWDILATSYLAIPQEFALEKVLAYVSEKPPNAGQSIIDNEGYEVLIATDLNRNAFYAYILNQFNNEWCWDCTTNERKMRFVK